MHKFIRKRSEKIGLPPGSFIYMGHKKNEEVRISIINYDEKQYQTQVVNTIEEALPLKDKPGVTWVNIGGLHEIEILEKISNNLNIHPLVIEDILNIHQRPKIEFIDNHIIIILKMIEYNENINGIQIEQLSLILGKNYVITFQENMGNMFDPVKERILNNKGYVRKHGTDYLAYTLLDIVIDHYFLILEKLGGEIDIVEKEVLEKLQPSHSEKIYFIKRELFEIRRCIWPLREILVNLQREHFPLIKKSTLRFIGDLHDHTIQVIDTVEIYRETISSLLDVFLTMINNRMNEIMKVLTMIATIFIPLSFFAGVYGMNFNTNASVFNMPELNWSLGYLFFWIFSLLIAGGLILFFKKRKWF